MKVNNLRLSFVTAISGFDASTASEQDIKYIKQMIYERKVVALKNQRFSREAYQKFAEHFGQLEKFKLKNYHDPEFPNILVINNRNSNGGIGARKLGNMWHSDSTYLREPLPLTFLYAQRVPENAGDTLFIDAEELLKDLPAEVRRELEGKSAIHDVRWTYKVKTEDIGESIQEILARLEVNVPPSQHPTIISHPRTGRNSLFINPGYTNRISGYTDEKSRELLSQVFSIALQSHRIFAYQWEAGDLLIWDNRLVWHSATELPPEAERIMYRIGVNDGGFFRYENRSEKQEASV